DRYEITSRHHEEHPDAGEKQERVVLAAGIGSGPDVADRSEDRQRDRQKNDELEEKREVIQNEHYSEDRPPVARSGDQNKGDQCTRDRNDEHRQKAQELFLRLADENGDSQEQEAAGREEELRREESPVRRVDLQRLAPGLPAVAASTAVPAGRDASAGDVSARPPTARTRLSDGTRSTSKKGRG